MSDFGVLSAVRQVLLDDKTVSELSHGVHMMRPPDAQFPLMTIELEEIWSNLRLLHTSSAHARVKFKISALSYKKSNKESLSLTEAVKTVLDGKIVKGNEGAIAILRLVSSVIEVVPDNQPRAIHQYYEALVRG